MPDIRTSDFGGIPYGNTAGRPANPVTGKLYSNGETARLELYTSGNSWENIVQEVPEVSSVTGTYLESANSGTIVIYGTNFVNGAIATAIGSNGVPINASSTTFNSLVQLTAVFSGLSNTQEPYDIKVTNPSNLFGIIPDALYVNASPVWTTTSGSLGTFNEQVSVSVSATATDSDSTITYALASGSILPSGITLNSSTGLISGTLPNITADTTYTFTINASDGLNSVVPRTFSITSLAITTAEVLVVAGGGGGSSIIGGGGGAGGVISNSSLSLRVGIPLTVTVGAGGRGAFGYTGGKDTEAGYPGYDSVLGSLTAIGGGGTLGWDTTSLPVLSGNRTWNKDGGSGGGGSGSSGNISGFTGNNTGGVGTTNQGFAGGNGADPYGAGGGGAGEVGHSQSVHGNLNGGNGVQSSITGAATYYGGGGGGGRRLSGGGNGPSSGGAGGGGMGMSGSAFDSNQNGTANTGGGGGGGNFNSVGPGSQSGGNGGSGVVIIAYPNTEPVLTISNGLTYDQPTRAGYRVYRFTAGTGTVTF
jgi:hypothetical protein